jgi:hypothetical protein
VIGAYDDNGIVPYACFFCGFHNLSDIAVQFRKLRIISRRVVTVGMTNVIRIIKNNGQKIRRFPLYVFYRHVGQCRRKFFVIRSLSMIIQRQGVHQVFNPLPFVQTADLGFRIGLAKQTENRGKNPVTIDHSRWNLRRTRTLKVFFNF